MCKKYYDVRAFGAVMNTGDKEDSKNDPDTKNEDVESEEIKGKGKKEKRNQKQKHAGVVRGPIQLSFATSISPINEQSHCLTRCAVTKAKDIEKEQTMGRKYTIPYGLYRAHGYISAFRAHKTGFSKKDLQIFWEALLNMFEEDSSSSHSGMTVCALYVF
jgi:CRISPR-associated protein Csd2